MKKEDASAGMITVIFGAFIFWTATGFGLEGLAPDPLGPGAFPKVLGIGFIILGILLIGISLKKKREMTNKESFSESGYLKVLLLIAIGILYTILLDVIGFILVTLLFVVGVMIITGERLWWKIGLSSVSVSIGLFFLFKELLKVMLPMGFGL